MVVFGVCWMLSVMMIGFFDVIIWICMIFGVGLLVFFVMVGEVRSSVVMVRIVCMEYFGEGDDVVGYISCGDISDVKM